MAKHITNVLRGDRTLWSIYFLLVSISLIEVFSAGSSLSFKSGNYMMPLLSQGTFIFVGLAIIIVLTNCQVRRFRPLGLVGLALSALGLFLTWLLGDEVNGSSRWISIAGFNFQTSEFVKPFLITGVAALLTTFSNKKGKAARKIVLGTMFLFVGAICFFILLENFSTAVLVGATVGVMLAVSEVPWKWLGKILGTLFVIAVIFIACNSLLGCGPDRSSTWMARIERFGNTEASPIEQNRPDLVDLDRDGQESHAKIAIATSGFFGKGPGNSVQRDYLSQAYSDFIFAIIVEEFGLLGGSIVVALYLWMFYSCIRISRRCINPFPKYLIIGLGTLIVLQALINVSVATGIIPITGQNLPLISRGGSSMLATSMMFGMMLSVSRYARRKDPPKDFTKLTAEEQEEARIEADFASMEPIN